MNLARSYEDKWIAGVAGGVGQSLGVDSTIVRIVFAILTVVSFGTGIFLYVALWVILPRSTGGTVAEDGIRQAKEWNADRKNRKAGGSGDGSDFTI